MDTIFGTVLFKRRPAALMPTLAPGEPGFATDTKEFFIGSDTGNISPSVSLGSYPNLAAFEALEPFEQSIPYFDDEGALDLVALSSPAKDLLQAADVDIMLGQLGGAPPSGTGGLVRETDGRVKSSFAPAADDECLLGFPGLGWRHFYMTAGSSIYFGTELTRISHGPGNLALIVQNSLAMYCSKTFGVGEVFVPLGLHPATNGSAALGNSTNGWQSLRLFAAGYIDFGNGQWRADHGAGIVTVGTGELRVTNPGTAPSSVVTREGLAGAVRERLTANRSYFVRTDGNDVNTGLVNTAGGAFKTIQRAVDAANALDVNGKDVEIRVADGTYTAGCTVVGPLTGARTVTALSIIGNDAVPANCIVSTNNAHCFVAQNGAALFLSGFELRTAVAGVEVLATRGGQVVFRVIRFGVCAASQIEASDHGRVYNTGNYSIVGGAVSHWHCTNFGYILAITAVVDLVGTPNFSAYFLGCNGGYVEAIFISFVGSAIGPRYYIHDNGVFYTPETPFGPNLTYLPGSIAGNLSGGGTYTDQNGTTQMGGRLLIHPAPGINKTFDQGGAGTAWQETCLNDTATAYVTCVMNAKDYGIQVAGSNAIYIGTVGDVYFPLVATTANAANGYLHGVGGNQLFRSTSSKRYKRDIEPLSMEYARRLLDVEPVWFRSRSAGDRADWSFYGIVAEQMAEVDPRLVHFGYREEDYDVFEVADATGPDMPPQRKRVLKLGAQLVPDGVQYERIIPGILLLLKDALDRLGALEKPG